MRPKNAFTALAAVLFTALAPASARGALGPGNTDLRLVAGQSLLAGSVNIHNSNAELLITVETTPTADPYDRWLVKSLHVHAGHAGAPPPVDRALNPLVGKFLPFSADFVPPYKATHELAFTFDRLPGGGFGWGATWESTRIRHVAVHADLVKLDRKGKVVASETAWATADNDHPFLGSSWARWFEFEMAHLSRGHFVDSPVEGLLVLTQTAESVTDQSGGFDYFPGERASFYVGSQLLGTAEADQRVSPLDLFNAAEVGFDAHGAELTFEDRRVGNVARLLQSLDLDGDPKAGITITPQVAGFVDAALARADLEPITSWNDSAAVDALIDATIAEAAVAGVTLLEVSYESALENLERSIGATKSRKNVSKTPGLGTAKAKLELMPLLVTATKANGEGYEGGLEFYDEDGNFLYVREKVRPLVAVYEDQIPETGQSDIWGAVSRDDGKTFKRMNLSRSADLSSFVLASGEAYYGDTKKPQLVVRDSYMLVAWQSKFCRGGRPRYALDETSEYYRDDVWGVGGPQRSHDYAADGFPEVGELPYYCLWIARGTIDASGDISWRKPERITSGRRDVYQVAITGVKGAGFGIIWQEDPEGVQPGEAAGPGDGWSGATTSHKTDIWYTSIKWADFAAIDGSFVPSGDPEHSFYDLEWTTNRPMPAVPFELPSRLSDNDTCNTDNMKIETVPVEVEALLKDGTTATVTAMLPPRDAVTGQFLFEPLLDPLDEEWDGKHTGTHRYCYLRDANANGVPDLCKGFFTYVNSQDAVKSVCTTEDGRLLDGEVGASRPNINFMSYTRKDGVPSAWVIVAYEETKGVGLGNVDAWDEDPLTTHDDEKDKPDLGKNVIYHSFEFFTPELASGGAIVNLPATAGEGDDCHDLYLCQSSEIGCPLGSSDLILDWQGKPQFAYENARRPRMLAQPPGQAGSTSTVMVLLYKQGEEGKGRPSDIFMRRFVNPKDGKNPYASKNLALGAQNLSSVEPTLTWTNPSPDPDSNGDPTKIVKYRQTAANLGDRSSTNPYDDARAHRGILRGDSLYVAYTITPNWAASRNAHDHYDLIIRRSFNGGLTWTADPRAASDTCHTRVWKDYTRVASEDEASRKETYEETECFAPGQYEPGRNMTNLRNNKLTVKEPRLVGTPGTLAGSPYPEDVQDKDVYWVAFGTETNVPMAVGEYDEGEEAASVPVDLYYTYTRDRGQTYFKLPWVVNPDGDSPDAGTVVERWDWLARGDQGQSEAQLRMTPDGSRFYAIWNEEGLEGFDAYFRRIMSNGFPQNVGNAAAQTQ